MTAKFSHTEKQFEALRNSVSQLNDLRTQVERTQKQQTNLLKELLDVVEENPSQWEFKIIQKNRTIAEGPLNKQAHQILRATVDLLAKVPPGEGPGCSDRTGCFIIGESLGTCLYICHTTT